jgi:hypothetical protein
VARRGTGQRQRLGEQRMPGPVLEKEAGQVFGGMAVVARGVEVQVTVPIRH